jgi:hypothetical protein
MKDKFFSFENAPRRALAACSNIQVPGTPIRHVSLKEEYRN